MQFKKRLLQIIFCGEIVIFAGLYVYGAYGIKTLSQLHEETQSNEHALAQLKVQVAGLQHELNDWNNHSFYKEKIAREQLQMAREGDTIFYIS